MELTPSRKGEKLSASKPSWTPAGLNHEHNLHACRGRSALLELAIYLEVSRHVCDNDAFCGKAVLHFRHSLQFGGVYVEIHRHDPAVGRLPVLRCSAQSFVGLAFFFT
jgi:hypothetical protein